MPINVSCQCGQRFAAKDELAGKTVKCPKCGAPLTIPKPASDDDQGYSLQTYEPPPKPASYPFTGGGMGDLFDEAGMSAPTHSGPTCPSCSAPMRPDAVICVTCGFNVKLGRRMETVATPEGGAAHGHGGVAAQMMAKAHHEVETAPPPEIADNWGEGGTSYLLTCGMIAAVALFFVLGGGTLFLLDKYTSNVSPAKIVIGSGAFLVFVGWVWMTVLAFIESPGTGVLMLLGGIFCPCVVFVLGFMRWDVMKWALIVYGIGALMQIAGSAILQATS